MGSHTEVENRRLFLFSDYVRFGVWKRGLMSRAPVKAIPIALYSFALFHRVSFVGRSTHPSVPSTAGRDSNWSFFAMCATTANRQESFSLETRWTNRC